MHLGIPSTINIKCSCHALISMLPLKMEQGAVKWTTGNTDSMIRKVIQKSRLTNQFLDIIKTISRWFVLRYTFWCFLEKVFGDRYSWICLRFKENTLSIFHVLLLVQSWCYLPALIDIDQKCSWLLHGDHLAQKMKMSEFKKNK